MLAGVDAQLDAALATQQSPLTEQQFAALQEQIVELSSVRLRLLLLAGNTAKFDSKSVRQATGTGAAAGLLGSPSETRRYAPGHKVLHAHARFGAWITVVPIIGCGGACIGSPTVMPTADLVSRDRDVAIGVSPIAPLFSTSRIRPPWFHRR